MIHFIQLYFLSSTLRKSRSCKQLRTITVILLIAGFTAIAVYNEDSGTDSPTESGTGSGTGSGISVGVGIGAGAGTTGHPGGC